MSDLDPVVRRLKAQLAAEFEARLREALAGRDEGWLTEELVRVVVEREFGNAIGAAVAARAPESGPARRARLDRVRQLAVDEQFVRRFVDEHSIGHVDADTVELIRPGVPTRGTEVLRPEHRTTAGEAALTRAKDVLFALLFGDQSTATRLARIQRELLTVALPRAKAPALDFMRASTELAAAGTWQDPERVSSDERADNVLLEVEFGEVASEVVGRGVMTALRLINELEINEQVLYVRMVNLEETSLG